MSACLAQQSSIQLPAINYLRSRETETASISCRKRLLSEQHDAYSSLTEYANDNDDVNKRTKKGVRPHESKDKMHQRKEECSTLSFFESIESTRHCHSAPGILSRRKSLTHAPLLYYIKDVSSTQTASSFLPLLTTKTTLEKSMLAIHQQPEIASDNRTIDKSLQSSFLTCSEVAAYITAVSNGVNQSVLIIDCGSPLRHTERRIEDSLLLNVNDKISRKRLTTRGLKYFLNANQLTRLDKSDLIILYDDSIRSSAYSACSSMQSQLSSAMKCIYDEIKRYDTKKILYVLQSSFDEFYQHYPTYCYISTSTDEDLSSCGTVTQMDIDSSQMSEILPGLYLGSSYDAEDLSALQSKEIRTIINISTSIPCFFEDESTSTIKYLRLSCHDSSNQNILQHFESTFEFIHKQLSTKNNILVHCQGGVSRSPSFIIGYLMRYHSKTFDEAYQFVRQKRNIINPNFNFLGQLTHYQQILNDV